MVEFKNRSEFSSFIAEKAQSHKYFRLTGGFGNQLFGLSEAYLLHKVSGKPIIIDSSYIEHSRVLIPIWYPYIKNDGWFDLIFAERNENPITLFELQRIDQDSNHRKIDSKFGFIGWIPNVRRIERSGLFQSGINIFSKEHPGVRTLGCHIRGGDLAANPGIGTLDSEYYVRALKKINLNSKKNDPLYIHTDDEDFAKDVLSKVEKEYQLIFTDDSNPIETLNRMSSYKKFIGANSTLSFWAHFFSKNQKAIFPKEFYLNDWNWARKIQTKNSAFYISRFSTRRQAIKIWCKWRKNNLKNRLVRSLRELKSF